MDDLDWLDWFDSNFLFELSKAEEWLERKRKMNIDFTAQEIRLRLKPVGKPLGRNALETSVYSEYAEYVPARFVQELCGLVGGQTVYVEVRANGRTTQVVPVSAWRDPNTQGALTNVANFIKAAARMGVDHEGVDESEVLVFGSDRARWKLEVSCSNRTHDAIDNQSDRADARTVTHVAAVEANGIRSDF